jgi:hypothetical protein
MAGRTDEYRAALRRLRWPDAQERYLAEHSGLPGARANLELAHAMALEGTAAHFDRLLTWDPARAPENTPQCFLALCGTVGLGRLVADGDRTQLARLRQLASDPRWRVREGVALALQLYGKAGMAALVEEMRAWARGSFFEQRAAVAALCEPPLLKKEETAEPVLEVVDQATRALAAAPPMVRKGDDYRALRQALGYCWSVAVAAHPDAGKPALESWVPSTDPDVRWVMVENLKKARLERMDEAWVRRVRDRLG